MEFSRDEVRRQLAAARADQRQGLRPWRDALLRAFGGDNELSTGQKARLLGVPDRRGFLKVGGVTIVGAAVLAACGSDTTDVAESGGSTAGPTTTIGEEALTADLTLLRTASSLEALAVDTYQQAIDSGLVTTADVASAAMLFRDQHGSHAGALEEAIVAAGGTPFTEPNPFVAENVVDPAVAALTDERSVIALALTVETAAAETYTSAAGVLSSPTLRQAAMGIGGVEARHMAVLRGFLDEVQVPVAFLPTDEALTEEAYVGAGGASEAESG